MKFPDSFLDEIRARLPVSQVVAKRVKLKKAGREWKGLSPFKQEKTPSFTVNDAKGFYHCFASGEHGDIFKFVQVTEGLSFPEAVERLAEEAGVPLPKPDPAYERFEKKRRTLFEVMEAACAYYESCLMAPEANAALEYARRRGLSVTTITEFRIGYAPNGRSGLKDALLKQGISDDQLLECGLVIKPDDGRAMFDRFRDRLMVPIQDSKGNVIAFGGRTIRDDVQPKYLNSPETNLFKKGSVVFNFHRARSAAFEVNEIIVVEGYLDAIALYQAGIKNVVATLGTAFTERQLGLLWRLSTEPIVCFDGDRAGFDAANRAVDRILPELKIGQTVNFAFLPAGKDPDDFVRTGDVGDFKNLLKTALPLSEVLWNREVAGSRLDTPERKAALEARIKGLIDSIRENSVHRQYALTFRIRLSRLFWDHDRSSQQPTAHWRPIPTAGAEVERIFLGLLVEYPLLFERHIDHVGELRLSHDYDNFKLELLRIVRLPEDTKVLSFYKHIRPEFFQILDEVHGEKNTEKGLSYGHQLRRRFPILRMHPDINFVDSSIRLFLMMLQYRSMRRDLEESLREYQAQMNDETEGRLLGIARDLQEHESGIIALEHDLQEWASSIRSMFEPRPEAVFKKMLDRTMHEVA